MWFGSRVDGNRIGGGGFALVVIIWLRLTLIYLSKVLIRLDIVTHLRGKVAIEKKRGYYYMQKYNL